MCICFVLLQLILPEKVIYLKQMNYINILYNKNQIVSSIKSLTRSLTGCSTRVWGWLANHLWSPPLAGPAPVWLPNPNWGRLAEPHHCINLCKGHLVYKKKTLYEYNLKSWQQKVVIKWWVVWLWILEVLFH